MTPPVGYAKRASNFAHAIASNDDRQKEEPMDTENDPNTNSRPGARGAFPVDRPVEALLRDHELVRRLADAWTRDTSIAARKQAASQLLQAIELHSRLEEGVFYPAVRQVDAGIIGHFEEEHHKADDTLAAIKNMPDTDPQREPMLRQLIDMVLHHIDEEENDFFPKLERAHLDMTPIGLQMASFEASLVHTMTIQDGRSGARR
jgi:iron-sulfur cluster repair protein YtfE (RIC family)